MSLICEQETSGPRNGPNGGPRTPEGKAAANRNAVTHGLFAHETVLPAHGEDPAEYAQLLDELIRDLRPQNLLERHCVQTIASAFWRLRRYHCWDAERPDDPDLTPDQRLQKMERAQRAESTLHRRINTALKQLGRDLPDLLQTRAHFPSPSVASDSHPARDTQNCQNEPAPPLWCEATVDSATSLSPFPKGERCPMRADRGPSVSGIDTQNCRNELTTAPYPFSPEKGESRRAQLTRLRAERAQRKDAKGLHRV